MFGLVTKRQLTEAIEAVHASCVVEEEKLRLEFASLRRAVEQYYAESKSEMLKSLAEMSDALENLKDEKANLEARVDELEKSYASGSIQREQNEEPAVQVAPGFERFSSRKRRFEREHAADGMTPTGRQIAANMKLTDKPKPKAKEKR